MGVRGEGSVRFVFQNSMRTARCVLHARVRDPGSTASALSCLAALNAEAKAQKYTS